MQTPLRGLRPLRAHGTAEFPLVFDDDPHWNERGHAFVARTLVRLLTEQALIPTSRQGKLEEGGLVEG